MQKIRRACKSHIEQHHTCSLGWWCNYLVGGVLFSSKILSIKRPSRLGCLQNSNTQICKKWKKRVKMSKTGLLGTSFRILESGRPMMVFFSLHGAPIRGLQWPAICWGFLCQHVHGNTYPTGPRAAWFCQSSVRFFSSKIGGGCFSIIVVSLWLDDL